MSKHLEGANPSQQEAIEAVDGVNQICAVAGSGKTFTLTKKIGYMKEKGIKLNTVMVTTFTKAAAKEMENRLLEKNILTRQDIRLLTMGTTHSICFQILKKEYERMGHHLATAFKDVDKGVIDNKTEGRFLEDVHKSLINDRTIPFGVKEFLRDVPLKSFLSVLSRAKNDYIDQHQFAMQHAGEGARAQAYIEFYQRYEQIKWNERKIDMDDMLFLCVKLFKEHKDILTKYQRFYKYIMVDEAQDNNLLQYMFIQMVAAPENNIFIVGDDDQSMYGFRGARPDQFINLKQFYPTVRLINMEDNYRSNPGILDVANKLIANNTERLVKWLKAHKKDSSECVNYSAYKNEREEAEGIAHEIATLNQHQGYQHKQMAILYRTNAQSRALEESLIVAGVPYVIYGGTSFYERKEVKDIISYMRLAYDVNDNEAFIRVFNKPKRYLGKVYEDKVKRLAGKGSYYAVCKDACDRPHERDGITEFTELVEALRAMMKFNPSLDAMIDYILYEGKYEKFLMDSGEGEDEGTSRLENINTLKYAMNRFENLGAFFEYMEMMNKKSKKDVNGVQLMTIHRSKGLEFPIVFMAGVSEGLLPHAKSKEAEEEGKPKAIEEERRLAYVAMTRAESLAYVSSINSFNGKAQRPSRFVSEMGLKVKEEAVTGAE